MSVCQFRVKNTQPPKFRYRMAFWKYMKTRLRKRSPVNASSQESEKIAKTVHMKCFLALKTACSIISPALVMETKKHTISYNPQEDRCNCRSLCAMTCQSLTTSTCRLIVFHRKKRHTFVCFFNEAKISKTRMTNNNNYVVGTRGQSNGSAE